MLQQYISGLKGHQALSPGHRPGDKCSGICALKGQKLSGVSAFALTGRSFHYATQYPGRCPGLLAFWPFRPYLHTCIKSSRNLNLLKIESLHAAYRVVRLPNKSKIVQAEDRAKARFQALLRRRRFSRYAEIVQAEDRANARFQALLRRRRFSRYA